MWKNMYTFQNDSFLRKRSKSNKFFEALKADREGWKTYMDNNYRKWKIIILGVNQLMVFKSKVYI